jgi:APA family basic amino acid/polyamine antiporter
MTDTTNAEKTSPEKASLKRVITGPLLFAFIVGDTLGAGIYTLVGTMAADVGGVIWLPLLIALVVALLTAGTYAELITKYPHAGGAARYVDRAFGKPYLSFLIGFLMMASGITTAASLANAFAGATSARCWTCRRCPQRSSSSRSSRW